MTKKGKIVIVFLMVISFLTGGVGGYYLSSNITSTLEVNTSNELSGEEKNRELNAISNKLDNQDSVEKNNIESKTIEDYTIYKEDYPRYKMMYIDPITLGSQIGMMEWNNASEIGAKYFLDYYRYISLSDMDIKYTQFNDKDNNVYNIPKQIVENTVMNHFRNVKPEYIQTMPDYNVKVQCYISELKSDVANIIVNIIDIQESKESIIITYEVTFKNTDWDKGTYEVSIDKDSEDKFSYSSVNVLSGGSYSTSGVSTYQDWNYPRIIYYFEENDPITNLSGERNNVIAESNYREIKRKSNTKYEALFIDCHVQTLQEEWIRTQLRISNNDADSYRIFMGYRNVDDLHEIPWLVVSEDLQKKYDNSDIEYVEIKIVDKDIITADTMIKGPEKDTGFIREFLYTKNDILEENRTEDTTDNMQYFNQDEKLSDNELIINGLTPYISLDEALVKIGGYDKRFLNGNDMASYVKDNMRYVFTWQKGVYSLHAICVDDNHKTKVKMPRGIKVGDSLEDVLAKIPGKDKTPRKWADQYIYGSREENFYADLSFNIFSNMYDLRIVTESQHTFSMLFDKNNKLLNMQIYYRWEGNH